MGGAFVHGAFARILAEEVAEAAGHGGIEADLAVGFGVDESEVAGVEGEAVGGFVGVAVHGVAEDGVAVGFELDADLVLAAGVEFAAEMGDFLFGVGLHHEVAEDGEFALADVLGDVHFAGVGIFEEEVFELGFVLFGDAVHDDVVAAGDGMLEELLFERAEGVPGAGEDEEAGGVAVEAVDEMDLVFAVLLLKIIGEQLGDEGAFFLGVGGGEEAVGFVDDEDVGIEMDDLQAVGERGFFRSLSAHVGHLYAILRADRLLEAMRHLAIEPYSFIGEHLAQSGFLRLGVKASQFIHHGFRVVHHPIIRRFVESVWNWRPSVIDQHVGGIFPLGGDGLNGGFEFTGDQLHPLACSVGSGDRQVRMAGIVMGSVNAHGAGNWFGDENGDWAGQLDENGNGDGDAGNENGTCHHEKRADENSGGEIHCHSPCAETSSAPASRPVLFFHYKQIIEAAKEIIAFDGGGVPVVALQRAVVANDCDDVDGFEMALHHGEEFEADGHEGFAFFEAVGDVEGHVAAVFEHAVNVGDDFFHCVVIGIHAARIRRFGGGVQFADAARIIRIIDVGGIGRINEHKIGGVVGERNFSRIGLLNVRTRRGQVEATRLPAQFLGDIQRRARSAHRIDDDVVLPRVALQQLPDHPRWRCAYVFLVPVRLAPVILRGIFPECGGLEGKRRFVMHGYLRSCRSSATKRASSK
jgi:hypothetical protein